MSLKNGNTDIIPSGEGAAMSKFKLAVLDDIAEKKVEDELMQLKQQELDKTKELLEVTGLPEGTPNLILENAAKFNKPELGKSSSGIVRKKFNHTVEHTIHNITHKYGVQPTIDEHVPVSSATPANTATIPQTQYDIFEHNKNWSKNNDNDLLDICQIVVNLMNVATYDIHKLEIHNMKVSLSINNMNDKISISMENVTSEIASVDNLLSLVDIFVILYPTTETSVAEFIRTYIKMKRDGLI